MRPMTGLFHPATPSARPGWLRIGSVFVCLFCLWIATGFATEQRSSDHSDFEVPRKVQSVLNRVCLDCHSGEGAESGVRMDNLQTLDVPERLELFNRAQDQIFFERMPPEDSDVFRVGERETLAAWLRQELLKHNACKLDEKLRHPGYGNYVSHEKLFSGQIDDKPYTPSRRWLVSPQIFHERVNSIFALEGRARQGTFYGVTNPFVLPDHSGVRDYDITSLDGGHLLVMLNNAQWISQKQVFTAIHSGKDRRNLEHPNPKDRWMPPDAPAAFVTIAQKSVRPTEQELSTAIDAQFQQVLHRKATETEMARYLPFFQATIDLGGNIEGLRQMLVSVLLESEFLYRQEFGEGDPDPFGRRMLSAREAAQAISYALGDLEPDAKLIKAADEGRLNNRDDFRREVLRLLEDQQYYRGPVDPGLSGKNMQSHVTSHPKLVRFFREFFGYVNATKVFKDQKRSNGYYQNPSRGTAGTPGFLIKEADRIVDWHLNLDQDVFENLLTTDEFFVYHDKDNETGRKIIAEWTEAYEKLKDTDWKANPEKVIEDNLEFIRSKKSLRILGGKQKREFLRHMYFFGETIGKGRTPFTTVSFAHGYTYNHSTFYNLPPTPGVFRYGRIEQKNFQGLDDVEFWDYPVEQPFKIAQRKGILTHPAWLIAHSSNFHTDPIRRGRWIREKLLAGYVPDVPITVDAQVPENPHKTFRERVEDVTQQNDCWKCHQHMNPLGFPFEAFDDFGRYRLEEPLEYPEKLLTAATNLNLSDTYETKSVHTGGELRGTGNPDLDGEVADAFELIDRLAKSERVRQSIIRHAFRFFMGRNEMLSDSQTLIAADRAYVESGGSFKAVVLSLLTSDSFMYRKDLAEVR